MTQARDTALPGRLTEDSPTPDVSVVVTLFDEAPTLEELFRRCMPALRARARTLS
jgi:hypothetical protein